MLDRHDIEPDCDEATLPYLCLMALINCPVNNIWLQRFFMAILFVGWLSWLAYLKIINRALID